MQRLESLFNEGKTRPRARWFAVSPKIFFADLPRSADFSPLGARGCRWSDRWLKPTLRCDNKLAEANATMEEARWLKPMLRCDNKLAEARYEDITEDKA